MDEEVGVGLAIRMAEIGLTVTTVGGGIDLTTTGVETGLSMVGLGRSGAGVSGILVFSGCANGGGEDGETGSTSVATRVISSGSSTAMGDRHQ